MELETKKLDVSLTELVKLVKEESDLEEYENGFKKETEWM